MHLNTVAFIDLEVNYTQKNILDIGCIKGNDQVFHKNSVHELLTFIKGSEFICGHNFIKHDLQYIGNELFESGFTIGSIIDTLHLSPLLFPTKPYHALLKDDKLQSGELNNPVNDSIKSKELLSDEIDAFYRLPEYLQEIYYQLLQEQVEFHAFFQLINYSSPNKDVKILIENSFSQWICLNSEKWNLLLNEPVELAYSLALVYALESNRLVYSITPPWVLKNYPRVESILNILRNIPCNSKCEYCGKSLDIFFALRTFFGYENYRSYDNVPLQEMAVNSAVKGNSLLAVFPTGGGKSITFQIPALMSGKSVRGLTVVISPLQSLMKDQVDNLEKNGIVEAVTINGLLDPIERAKSIERIEDGSASIVYLSPESLRSKTIERLLIGRKIVRFVIDEAHCFSSWGQDFRVDYLYIADFIKSIQLKKQLNYKIPVSCFTATAKQKVIEDILEYFKFNLDLDLELFTSTASRTNLSYKVYELLSEEEKYQKTRELLELKNQPTIIYVSRTKKAKQLSDRLVVDGFNALAFHGKMEKQEKTQNQNAFLNGEAQIMVATSAFGMGVDKKDVALVIHYEISDSLENYIQEAGRAGRDENLLAECHVLYNEDDLSKHFLLLNQTKLSLEEIQQIWKAIKEVTKFRSTVSNSALEIARKAGWDDSVNEIETRVKTAIAALESTGYVKRGQNIPKVFANSILVKNVNEALERINNSSKFNENQKINAIRVIKKLIATKSRKHQNDESGESRIDYISDHLGIVKEEIIELIQLLREEKILADTQDLTAFIKKSDNKNRSLHRLIGFNKLEKFIFSKLSEDEQLFHPKIINEEAEIQEIKNSSISNIKTVLNFWSLKNWIFQQRNSYSQSQIHIKPKHSLKLLRDKLELRHELAIFCIEYLYSKSLEIQSDVNVSNEVLIEFSIIELKQAFENSNVSFGKKVSTSDIEDAFFYLSKIDALKIEGGFMVVYNQLTIERIEKDNKRRFKIEDYEKLHRFYENKIQQIHIVGEYARKMIRDYQGALQFVDDYFHLNYGTFLNKYFNKQRQSEIKRNITPKKFNQIFGALSPAQLSVILEKDSDFILVAAGPGSGKTRLLVHKLASLLLMEDVKHEQLLMLTFSRSAAMEFKKRLYQLIGNAASFIQIKTFHSFCFDILGKIGNIQKSTGILSLAINQIRNDEIEASYITKTVLVIDEAQDMNQEEYELIKVLKEKNEELRIIAVGDDDQNIFSFRGANSAYLTALMSSNKSSIKVELLENYRSSPQIVEYSNFISSKLSDRLKVSPNIPVKDDSGIVNIYGYKTNNNVVPLVNNLRESLTSGSKCILTRTNDEAWKLMGYLSYLGINAKLIQSNEGFNLTQLLEIRYFIRMLRKNDESVTISDEIWENSKNQIDNKFPNSPHLKLIHCIFKSFEEANPQKKYYSDFMVFIQESSFEDFFENDEQSIIVSTIHKAKGKEFDEVHLLLNQFNVLEPDEIRMFYVAVTRAKTNLFIHVPQIYIKDLNSEPAVVLNDSSNFLSPQKVKRYLTHRDVWLSYFLENQLIIKSSKLYDELTVTNGGCINKDGIFLLKFSKKFNEEIEKLKSENYFPRVAKPNMYFYWKQKDSDKEVLILLPEIEFDYIQN